MSKDQITHTALPELDWRAVQGERRGTILAAALLLFMRHGFSRVTMDDVAREAGISRPALYRDFRNKADIYAAIAASLLDHSASRAERALSATGDLDKRLVRAIEAGMLEVMAAIAKSPHGVDILEQKMALTADIHARWRARMMTCIADAIGEEARTRGVDLDARRLSPDALAETLLDAVEGLKQRVSEPKRWRAATVRIVSLIVLALK